MYKDFPKQISFEDFNQPVGLKMNPKNKWVKKAILILWDEIEHEYAKLFKGFNGQVAKLARLALGALLIQIEYDFQTKRLSRRFRRTCIYSSSADCQDMMSFMHLLTRQQ